MVEESKKPRRKRDLSKEDKQRASLRARRRLCLELLASESPEFGDIGEGESTSDSSFSSQAVAWAGSLPASRLELLTSIKQLAVQRSSALGEAASSGIFTWKTLQCLDIIMEEFMKHRLETVCPELLPKKKEKN